jgi:formate dehydrogenase maturation protein FdhE
MRSVDGLSTDETPLTCSRCGAAGTVFYVSRFATPVLSYVACGLCAYRWVVPVAAVRRKSVRPAKPKVKSQASHH